MDSSSRGDPSAVLARKIAALFPGREERVATTLSAYGTEEYEKEAVRVRLAVLKLSGGDVEKVEYYLQEAKKDYRDVLAWAEYPEQVRAKTWELGEEAKRGMQERDLEQYRVWLNKDRPL